MTKIKSYLDVSALSMLLLCFIAICLSVSVTTITFLLAFLLIFISGDWKVHFDRIRQNPGVLSFWLLGALFLYGLTYTTSSMHLALQDLQKRHWLFIMPFFVVVIRDERWRRRMLNAFLVTMFVTVILSYAIVKFHLNIYQWLPSFIHLQSGIVAYNASVFQNHIVQGLLMSLAAYLCGYRYLFEKKHRLFYLLFFILFAIDILILSAGRTAYGIFILLLGYLALIRFGFKGLLYAAVLAICILGFAYQFSAPFKSRINAIYTHTVQYKKLQSATSIGQRVEMWGIAKAMIKQRPIMGYGTGGIKTMLPKVVPLKHRRFNPHISFVENIYLNFMLQFGVVGLLVLCFAIFLQVKTSFRLPTQYKHLFQAVLISLFFGGVFNAFFVSFMPAHIYALFAALCLSSLPLPSREKV